MKAFVFDPLWDDLVTPKLLADLKDASVEVVLTKEIAPLSDCKALFAGDEERILCLNPDYVGWKLSSEDYKDIPNLKAILGAATSFSWIDMSYATAQDIPVCNIKGFSAEAVAEWATMMMFNLARQTPRLIKDGFPLDYDKDFMKYRGIELHGKTAGIIGMGRIGKAIADRCKGLGMKVIYWSKNSKVDGYEYKDLNQLMAEADVVFPIMALNDETKQLVTHELLDSMKPTAILVDEVDDLLDRDYVVNKVRTGTLYGFGFEAKPASFSKYEGNIWAAPSYGWATDGSMHNSVEMWVENMVSATKGEFPNRIN